jgi:hypothetical protein
LGTPKANHYSDFTSLPFSGILSSQIKKEDGTYTESHSRIFKHVKSLLPEEFLRHYSHETAVPGNEKEKNDDKEKDKKHKHHKDHHHKDKKHDKHDKHHQRSSHEEENDCNGIVDFFVHCLQLVPKKRKEISFLLEMNLFQKKTSAFEQFCQVMHCFPLCSCFEMFFRQSFCPFLTNITNYRMEKLLVFPSCLLK